MTSDTGGGVQPEVLRALRSFWGYERLRPLQGEAISAELAGRDSVVVLPTGGGKSLCYQIPPVVAGGLDVVVSPLISLMKDQVDGLASVGYPAAALHSGLSGVERDAVEGRVSAGEVRLLLCSPERLVMGRFQSLLERVEVRAFAIDEAHCISHWGHDFRKEYRQLALLRKRFPGVSVHAYTATATERVRFDIAEQLGLRDPLMLVGSFDRPNLTYRILPRMDVERQIFEVLQRHDGKAAIVYCISRRETEAVALALQGFGVRAGYYHAGLSPELRRETQEAFANEALDVVVATVAFGMGIDRSNVRCVIHAAMPKSVEHYQQETGRAGRDGLEAECVLFYSPADAQKWESLILKSAAEGAATAEATRAAIELLHEMRGYCATRMCRHRRLVEYFGQEYVPEDCQACDVCLDEVERDEQATVLAQKILSCVARVEQRFGVTHVVKVLQGARDKLVRSCGHDRLSTFGLLKDMDRKVLSNLVYQLVDQGLLERTPGDRPLLKLNARSWEVLRGNQDVYLAKPKPRVLKVSTKQSDGWGGVDRALFERLREERMKIAQSRGVPPYVIFGDASLRDMARAKPTTLEAFAQVHGVGQRRLKTLGTEFVAVIRDYVRSKGGEVG